MAEQDRRVGRRLAKVFHRELTHRQPAMSAHAPLAGIVLETVTRDVFNGLSWPMEVTFYLVATGAIAAFVVGIGRRVRRYRQGRPDATRLHNLPGRVARATRTVLSGQTLFRNNPYAGVMHTLVLWGFLALFVATTILLVEIDILVPSGGPVKALLETIGLGGLTGAEGSRVFWKGLFYKVYQFGVDIFGLLFVLGVGMALFRRVALDVPRLDLSRVDDVADDRRRWMLDDWVFLGLLFAIGVTGLLIEGIRLAVEQPAWAWPWNPVGVPLATALEAVYWGNLASVYVTTWWVHAIIALGFIAYLPYSKAVHMLASGASLALRDDDAGRRLPAVPESTDAGEQGYRELEDFSWEHLLEADACTKCGRCHEVCPARQAGTDLSPRDIILDIRQSLATDGGTVVDDTISSDRLWACTTCRACIEACPVGIEHVPQIVQMRRALIEDGEMDSNLQGTLMDLMQRENSFGESAKKRAKWTRQLESRPTDARRESVEYLWYVGDYASYHDTGTPRARTLARLFAAADVDFGILYEDEANAGNDVRRVGEEGLFEMLAEQNIETLERCEYDRIVTTDPHVLNTLRNEYPDLDFEADVIHYTTLLREFLADGTLELAGSLDGRATYHDPCYLGRYNEVFDAPRDLIEATGVELVEMDRNRSDSFCCGAGGGRIYMDTSDVETRPSVMRIEEAREIDDIEYFVVACPKDMAMFTDAAKAVEGDIEVIDILDLVAADLKAPRLEAEVAVA